MMKSMLAILFLISVVISPQLVALQNYGETLPPSAIDWRCLIATAASDEGQSEAPSDEEDEEPDCD